MEPGMTADRARLASPPDSASDRRRPRRSQRRGFCLAGVASRPLALRQTDDHVAVALAGERGACVAREGEKREADKPAHTVATFSREGPRGRELRGPPAISGSRGRKTARAEDRRSRSRDQRGPPAGTRPPSRLSAESQTLRGDLRRGRRRLVPAYIPGVFMSNSMLKRLAFLSGLLSPQSPSIEPPPVAP